MAPASIRLERIDAPPLAATAMPADAGRAFRRGALTWAQHAKLRSRLYLSRSSTADIETRKLPSSTGAVTLSDGGRVFLVDKQATQVSELVEGACRPVFQAADAHRIGRLYATGDVLWLSEGARRPVGMAQVTPDRIVRLVDDNGHWRCTHRAPLSMKTTTFAGSRELLVLLDSDGDVTACVPSPHDETIRLLGTRGRNFTDVAECQGQVLALSFHERNSAWIVTQEGAPGAALSAPAEVTRLDAFPPETRERMEQWLRDSTNDAVHAALGRIGAGGSRERREERLRAEGRTTWSLVRAELVADFGAAFDIEVGGQLAADLERAYLQAFEDAASW